MATVGRGLATQEAIGASENGLQGGVQRALRVKAETLLRKARECSRRGAAVAAITGHGA